ncbi:hypothetical protein V8G54_025372 [Vigna mungo]|uniref:Uncharacterized protein n=1 Tax=Vigna mungo TaxID=3915 RepID=A0AAQ3MXN6_VIGMU
MVNIVITPSRTDSSKATSTDRQQEGFTEKQNAPKAPQPTISIKCIAYKKTQGKKHINPTLQSKQIICFDKSFSKHTRKTIILHHLLSLPSHFRPIFFPSPSFFTITSLVTSSSYLFTFLDISPIFPRQFIEFQGESLSLS